VAVESLTLGLSGQEPVEGAASLVALPTYEYRCPNGHVFELFQSIHAPKPEACTICGAGPLEVVLHPVAVHFKGSGFYSTDYGRGGGRKKDTGSKDGDSSSGDSKPSESTEKKDKPTEKKAAEA
jgi:putative FmdB family regulatory protein